MIEKIKQAIQKIVDEEKEDLEIRGKPELRKEPPYKYKVTFIHKGIDKYHTRGFFPQYVIDKYIDNNNPKAKSKICKEIKRVSVQIDQKIRNESQKKKESTGWTLSR